MKEDSTRTYLVHVTVMLVFIFVDSLAVYVAKIVQPTGQGADLTRSSSLSSLQRSSVRR